MLFPLILFICAVEMCHVFNHHININTPRKCIINKKCAIDHFQQHCIRQIMIFVFIRCNIKISHVVNDNCLTLRSITKLNHMSGGIQNSALNYIQCVIDIAHG